MQYILQDGREQQARAEIALMNMMNDSDVGSGAPYTGVDPSEGYYIFQAIFLTLVMVITILGNVAVSCVHFFSSIFILFLYAFVA